MSWIASDCGCIIDCVFRQFDYKLCYLYTKHANVTVRSLYPNPTGALRKALKENLATFYKAVELASDCKQVYPYGK